MIRVIFPVAALLLSVAILQTGNGLQGVLLPIRAVSESFSTLSIALLGSTYFIGFIGGCLYGPRLVSQVGHIRVFTAMAALASATPLAHGLIVSPLPWWLLRVVTGFCFAVIYIVIESWLNERATKETRGLIFATYLIINMTLMTLGQLMVVFFDTNGLILFAISSILVSLAAVPVALSNTQAPALGHHSKTRLLKLFKTSPVGFVGCLSAGAVMGSFWALTPQFASSNGLDTPSVALFMSLTVISGAIGQGPIGMLSDRFDRRYIIAFISLLAAIASILLWKFSSNVNNNLYLFAATWGFFAFPIYGLSVAHANDFAKPDEFVEVSSSLLLIYATGAVVGPIIAGTAMNTFGFSTLYGFTATAQLMLVIYAVWRSQKRPAPEIIDQVPFIDALVAAQSVSTVIDEALQEDALEASRPSKLELS